MPSPTQQYANRDWVRAEINSLKEGVREAKLLGFEARELAGKPHECKQRAGIESLREEQLKIVEELGHWRFFKKLFFVVTSLLLSVILTAAGAVISFAMSAQKSTANIESSVKNLNTRQGDLVRRVNDITANKPEEQQKQLEQIQKVIEDTFVKLDIESDNGKDKKRR